MTVASARKRRTPRRAAAPVLVAVPDIVPLSPPPPITAADRLGLTLFFAVVLHAMIILGVGIGSFNAKPVPDASPPLEITLVTQRSAKKPVKADYLAQLTQEGGGNVDTREPVKAPPPPSLVATPAPPPDPMPAGQLATPSTLAFAPQPPTPQVEPTPPEPAPQPAPPPKKKSAKAKKEVLTQAESQQKISAPSTPAQPAPSAAQLISRSMEIASLSAQINESVKSYAQRPKQKFISASTKEYKYAAYMEAWRMKVENIGNLNYPDEANRRNLTGSVLLDVALNPDGTVNDVTVRKSSGEKVLDDAAVRIVQLAAPYAAFPDAIRKETDILHITRTWRFTKEHRLSSR